MTEKTRRIVILIYVILPFVTVITAAVLLWNRYVFWTDIALMLVLQFFCTLGITVGYHRMLTHDSFKAVWPVRAFFIMCGCMALEGKPIEWVATHIKHHAFSDDDDDPHSPLKSFFHAHMGWLFSSANFADPKEYAPDLLRNRLVVFIDRLYFLWVSFAFLIPFALGGFTGLLWGGFVRVFLTTHITWSVNSICHTFGGRAFETTDESRNNWIVGLLAFGEGWHNNHHAFPKNAFHGMWWYQFDLSGLVIRALEGTGLAWDVQRVTDDAIDAHRTKSVSMIESIAQLKQDLGRFIDQGRNDLQEMMLKLPPQRVALVRYAYENTMRQCAEIQLGLERRRTMKRAAIERRRQKVAKLFVIAKQQLQMASLTQ
ncbi:acyl-CoA desaturase [Candidatus Peregrinibacteria bacterium]|nr:acyl-CoA desaturase [Candidatus Peregrinibacteria bacterium]